MPTDFPHLLPNNYKRFISEWLEEDCPSFDYGGFVVGEAFSEAYLLGKSEGYLAGVPFFDEVFRQLDCTVEWKYPEGSKIKPIEQIAIVRGPVRKILLGERVALNILARCSGIATKSNDLLVSLLSQGYEGILAGTRKTTPGFRLVEKYGMIIGGCDPHRQDLSTMIMLKDNHIWSRGSITAAVSSARLCGGFSTKIEVEVLDIESAKQAVDAGADIVMLDNFKPEDVAGGAKQVKEYAKAVGKRLAGCLENLNDKTTGSFPEARLSGGATQM
ncbi:MAG: hypothetical protein M1829_002550 [Trizodia sp. TS-e1964]|nr:MAG: hypothetical protein M1829_002550 [Trizodia sp. TS-e1964]